MGELVQVTTLPACDFCHDGTRARYDFKTQQGPWANGCAGHYLKYRAHEELGTGRGQELVAKEGCVMGTRTDVITQLRGAGYEGPVSYSKGRLLEILSGLAPAVGSTTPPAASPGHEKTTEQPPKRTGRSRGRTGTVRPDRFDRSYEWEGVTPAHDIQVSGEPGWYHFMSLTTNPATGESWLDAYGGAHGHASFRAFALKRVRRTRAGVPKTRPTHVKQKQAKDEEDT